MNRKNSPKRLVSKQRAEKQFYFYNRLSLTVGALRVARFHRQWLADLSMHHQRHITQNRSAERLDHTVGHTGPGCPPWLPQSPHQRRECTTAHVARVSARFFHGRQTRGGGQSDRTRWQTRAASAESAAGASEPRTSHRRNQPHSFDREREYCV